MTEDQLQQKIVIDFRNRNLKNDNLIFSVPNGGSRNQLEAMKLKKTGTMAGVSDLIIIVPNRILFLELKTEKGIQSEVQKNFQNKVEALGFKYCLIRNLKDYEELMQTLLK
jgi:hypothetical protein